MNGTPHRVDADPATPLLWVLRDHLGMLGTKFGCGAAQCGACTVHIDGEPTRACIQPLSEVAGRAIVTIEGVDGPAADAVRAAWRDGDVPQCGYCQAGQIMSAVALLRLVPAPDDATIDGAMSGNLCRCGTYGAIRAAIHDAATRLASRKGNAA